MEPCKDFGPHHEQKITMVITIITIIIILLYWWISKLYSVNIGQWMTGRRNNSKMMNAHLPIVKEIKYAKDDYYNYEIRK